MRVMQQCPGVLERLGLAYLRQHREGLVARPGAAGPPTQLSHCPNLGLTPSHPPLPTVLISQTRNEQNHLTNSHDEDNDRCDGDTVDTHAFDDWLS